MIFGREIFIDFTSWFSIINFIFVTCILLISFYFDYKFRIVPINLFKICYGIALFLNIFESLLFLGLSFIFLLVKLFIFLFVFLLSFILFILKIIGGSDGKLIILVFIIHPISLLNLSILFTFFFVFSLLFAIFFSINLIINHFKNHSSFELFFNLGLKISALKKYYIKTFYNFHNFSGLSDYNETKYLIKSLVLILNNKNSKIQILCQLRPPLTIIIMPTYYIIYYLTLIV